MRRTALSTVSQICSRSNTTTSLLGHSSTSQRSLAQWTSLPRPSLPRSSTRIYPLSKSLSVPVRPKSSLSGGHNVRPGPPHKPLTDRVSDLAWDAEQEAQNRRRREKEPKYRISFTCKPCGHRSSHEMSKHGYHHGTVLIQCPECSRRHVISDHLGIFLETKMTLEEVLAEQGENIKKGYTEGDMEFWDDGTVTKAGEEGGGGSR